MNKWTDVGSDFRRSINYIKDADVTKVAKAYQYRN